VIVIAVSLALTLRLFLKAKLKPDWIITTWPFITRHYDFIMSNFDKTNVLLLNVHKAFFDNKSLRFSDGDLISAGAVCLSIQRLLWLHLG
jgi:hypothetical protein